jgi:hypothetical protein
MTREHAEIPPNIKDDVADLIAESEEFGRYSPAPNDDIDRTATPDTCAIMREMVDRGYSPRGVSREIAGVSHKQVNYHVSGRCSCDDNDEMRYDECMRMRIAHRKGAPTRTLALLSDYKKTTVRDHLCGECSHEDGIAPTVADTQPETQQGIGAD